MQLDRLFVATTNPHKISEIAAVFDAEFAAASRSAAEGSPAGARSPQRIRIVSWPDIAVAQDDVPEPVEDQPTFEGNAELKAAYYARVLNIGCLADDSGLAVDALGGAPGVRSARYSGASGPRDEVDRANNRLLLQELADTPLEQRAARFVCAMALAVPVGDGSANTLCCVRGEVLGRILLPAECDDPEQPWLGRGRNGFGYDPLFHVTEQGRTTAEMSPDEKNGISHRGAATRLMAAEIRRLLADGSLGLV